MLVFNDLVAMLVVLIVVAEVVRIVILGLPAGLRKEWNRWRGLLIHRRHTWFVLRHQSGKGVV